MIGRELSEGVAEWLVAHLPAGFDRPVLSEQMTGPKERPDVVVVVEPGESPHPKLATFTLTMRGEYLPEQADQAGFPDQFQSLVGVLANPVNFQSLRGALAPRGMLLRVLRAQPGDEAVHEENARRCEVPFAVTVQTAIPAGSAGI